MKRHPLVHLLLLFTCSVLSLQARHLSAEESLQRFLSQSSTSTKAPLAAASQYALAYTAMSDAGESLYVFDVPGRNGFVILSADDSAPALLGCSTTGAFNAENIPDGLRCWMEWMSHDIRCTAASTASASTAAKSAPHKAQRADIEPLCQVFWAQDTPFCDDCPGFYDESYGRNRKAQAGCVAVAMAQVMYRYQWPRQGAGSHSYINNIDGKSYSVDFSTQTYNWDRLAFAYGSYSSNGTSYNASNYADIYEEMEVAKLMHHCGVAVDMQYDHPKLGSGTDMEKAVDALRDYFGYDAGIHINKRFDKEGGEPWADADWEGLIYDELAASRPVIYGGKVPSGGAHAFVLDGYRDGLFHVNWGWSGIDNGYFALSGTDYLHVSTQQAGFTFYQRCITGIVPADSQGGDGGGDGGDGGGSGNGGEEPAVKEPVSIPVATGLYIVGQPISNPAQLTDGRYYVSVHSKGREGLLYGNASKNIVTTKAEVGQKTADARYFWIVEHNDDGTFTLTNGSGQTLSVDGQQATGRHNILYTTEGSGHAPAHFTLHPSMVTIDGVAHWMIHQEEVMHKVNSSEPDHGVAYLHCNCTEPYPGGANADDYLRLSYWEGFNPTTDSKASCCKLAFYPALPDYSFTPTVATVSLIIDRLPSGQNTLSDLDTTVNALLHK